MALPLSESEFEVGRHRRAAQPVSTSEFDQVSTHEDGAQARRLHRWYPWLVVAVAFALLLSDYMSRQVLSAVFPTLKQAWHVSDSQLGSLTSIVALMVAVLTFPLSVVADRFGRVKSLIAMAIVWSLATLGCAVASGYHEMMIARFFVGVGEAAYGSVGIAVVLSVFASRMHATLGGAFMAGGSFGSVIGVALGGFLADRIGWRWAFAIMAIIGLVLVLVFRLVVTEKRLARYAIHDDGTAGERVNSAVQQKVSVRTLFTSAPVWFAYIGSGLQMLGAAVLLAWMPSFFNRYYHMHTAKAAATASLFVLCVGAGILVCGFITDRVSIGNQSRKWTSSIVYCAIALAGLMIGFHLPNGPMQLTLIGIGAFFSGGCCGPAAAVVAGLTHESVRSSAMGTLTLANNLLGLALGPWIVGILADSLGLKSALALMPIAYLVAIVAFLVGKVLYPAGVRKLAAQSEVRAEVEA